MSAVCCYLGPHVQRINNCKLHSYDVVPLRTTVSHFIFR